MAADSLHKQERERLGRSYLPNSVFVTPAKAGVQGGTNGAGRPWMLACSGMTTHRRGVLDE